MSGMYLADGSPVTLYRTDGEPAQLLRATPPPDDRLLIEGNFQSYNGSPTLFSAYTGMWGIYRVPDLDATSAMRIDESAFPANTTFEWDVTPHPDWGGVNGFLFVSFGNFDWAPNGFITPRQAGDITTLTVDIDWTFTGDARSGLLAECWLTATPHEWGELTDKTHEVGWFPKLSPSGWSWVSGLPQLGSFVSAGVTWRVAQGVSGDGIIPYFVAYRPDASDYRGLLHYHDYFAFLQGLGAITGDEWHNGNGFGVEPHIGAGSLTVNRMDVTYA